MALDIDKLISNPNFRVIISAGGSWGIEGYLTTDFSFSSASTYSGSDSAAGNALNASLAELTSLFSRATDAEISTMQLKSIAGTMLLWQGSENLAFSIPLMFVATRSDIDVRKKVSFLFDALYPTLEEGSMDWTAKVKPPLGYTKGKAEYPKGCVSVTIGSWFSTTSVFVIKGVDFTFSKEVIGSGNPLYATVNISLECCRILQASEIKSFFIGI